MRHRYTLLLVFVTSVLYLDRSAAGQGTSFRLEEAGVEDINTAFDSGVLTSEALVQMYLNRIEAYDQQGPSLNSIITLNPSALETAKALDAERQATGPRSPLHGVPVLLKDTYDTFDLPTTAGSLALQDSIPPDDAFLVQRLRDAGAVILGKTNLYEFAVAPNTVSSLGGQTLNPYDTSRIPGGSSGGTGAALAANFATLGMGTDTGGSIRFPASVNSLVGLKPTMGLTSRDGILPFTAERDIGGPMARSVADVAYLLDVVAGHDPADPVTETSVGHIPDTYTDFLDQDGLIGARIGVVRQFMDSADAEIVSAVNTAIDDMAGLGAEIVDSVDLGSIPGIANSLYLSFRYDMNNYLESLGENAPFQTVDEIIQSGKYLPTLNFFPFGFLRPDVAPAEDPTYAAFQRTAERIQDRILDVMETRNLDALLYPSVAQKPPRIGQADFLSTLTLTDNTHVANLTGLPAISVPGGFTADGLPVGIELMGKPFSEPTLIGLAYSYEQATNHRTPPTTTPALEGEVISAIQAGDADRDFDFDQLDLVQVQIAAKYLTGQTATWGEGDWNGAPGGSMASPPVGDGLFNQLDIVAAQQAGIYLAGPYAAIRSGGDLGEVDLVYVPEPGSALLVIIGTALGVICRHRSHRKSRPCVINS